MRKLQHQGVGRSQVIQWKLQHQGVDRSQVRTATSRAQQITVKTATPKAWQVTVKTAASWARWDTGHSQNCNIKGLTGHSQILIVIIMANEVTATLTITKLHIFFYASEKGKQPAVCLSKGANQWPRKGSHYLLCRCEVLHLVVLC